MAKEKYTPEFFKWAREHGYPDRMPRGDPSNYQRATMLIPLYNQYIEEMREARRAESEI